MAESGGVLDRPNVWHFEETPVTGMTIGLAFPRPAWKFCFGGDWHSIVFHVVGAPNWFQRWAQRVCLGIHWEKL